MKFAFKFCGPSKTEIGNTHGSVVRTRKQPGHRFVFASRCCFCCLFYFSSSSNEICHSQPRSDAYCKFTYFFLSLLFVTAFDSFLRFRAALSISPLLFAIECVCVRIGETSHIHFFELGTWEKISFIGADAVFFPFPRRMQNGRQRLYSFHLHLQDSCEPK